MSHKQDIIDYWIEKAYQDLASARDNLAGKRFQNAISDEYFACFHALAALLFKEGKTFRKHREVRASLHRDYIKTGKIEPSWGKHYDWLFENRQKADYSPLVSFESNQVRDVIEQSSKFVKKIEQLVSTETNQE